MKLLKNNIKYFLGIRHISITSLVAVLFYTYFLIKDFIFAMGREEVFYLLGGYFWMPLIMFILFTYISYEFIYNFKKSGAEETISAHNKGFLKTFFSMLTVPLLLVGVIFIVFITANFVISIMCGITDVYYYLHILLVGILNTLILYTIACFFGGILALKFKRVASYSIIIIIFLIISPVTDMFLFMLSDNTGINFWEGKWFFSKILPQNLEWVADMQYGLSNEILRWNLSFFWLFLFLGIVLLAVSKKKQKKQIIITSLCFVLAAFNLVGYFKGGSELIYGPPLNSITRCESDYYVDAVKKEEKAEFKAVSYNMDISLWRDLKADVNIKIDNPKNLKEYIFTLYRGFKVKKITDENGKNLSFKQDGDYITINSNKPVSEINFKYKGKSVVFYSNVQGAALPGTFPYYPMPGFHILNDSILTEDNKLLSSSGYLKLTNEKPLEYNIKVHSPKKVYSNIKEVKGEKNSFSGKVKYPTIMSGFIEKRVENNFTYYPITISNNVFEITPEKLNKLQKEINIIEKEKGYKNHLDLSEKTIFHTSEIFRFASYTYITALDDQIFIAFCDDDSIKEIAKHLVEEYNNYA